MTRKCKYCGSTWHTEEEHVIAKSKGGKTTVDACRPCNRSKREKPLMQWLHEQKSQNTYRWRRIKKHNYGRKNPIAKKVQKVRDE